MSVFITNSTVCLCTWIVLVITSYTLGIIQIIAICRFLAMQHLVIVKKRYPKIIVAEAIVSIISLLLIEPLWANVSLGAIQLQPQMSQNIFQTSIHGVAPFVSHFILYAEACRLWLMYFDLNYLHSSKDNTWKEIIDTSFPETEWFLQNRRKWGNKSFVARFCCILYLISAGFCSFMFVFAGFILAQLTDAVFILIPCCFIVYIYCKCPKDAKDRFWFHLELRAIAITFGIGISSYFILLIPEYLGYSLINLICSTFLVVIVLSVPSLISILIIPCKISSSSEWYKDNNAASLSISLIIKNHKSELDKSLVETIQNKRFFSDFILFVSQEFSLEIVLSLIEMIQFQTLCKQNQTETCAPSTHYVLPLAHSNIIPQSTIVYGSLPSTYDSLITGDSNEGIKQLKVRAYLLYQKYVERNSLFEVNISGPDRMDLIVKMDDIIHWMDDIECERNDLCNLFAKVIEEQQTLLLSSFGRYKEYIKCTIH
eukprot:201191_1